MVHELGRYRDLQHHGRQHGAQAAFNHGFAYWLYGGFSVLAALFVWKFVPESKGMSLENMQKLWKTKTA